MPNNQQAKAPKTSEKKRVIRNDEEILADLEAKLAEKRAKVEAKKNKERDAAWAKRAKLVQQREAIDAKVAEIDEQFPQTEAPAETPVVEDSES